VTKTNSWNWHPAHTTMERLAYGSLRRCPARAGMGDNYRHEQRDKHKTRRRDGLVPPRDDR